MGRWSPSGAPTVRLLTSAATQLIPASWRFRHFLESNKEILWLVRTGLLACVVLHILAAARLSAENKAARPVGYLDDPNPIAASYASRTMLMSGLIIAAFIFYHLLHYTVQV